MIARKHKQVGAGGETVDFCSGNVCRILYGHLL